MISNVILYFLWKLIHIRVSSCALQTLTGPLHRERRPGTSLGQEYRDSSITDLASVPRIFWTLLPPDGKYANAAIIHDYLYDNALRTKKEADLIFLDGMTVLGVPKWKRIVMYLAVRWFGRGMYGKERKYYE